MWTVANSYPSGPRENVIDVGGVIETDTLWNADLVRVFDHINVADGVTLTIAPGTRVEFQGFFALVVAGTLAAVGEPAEPIVFTTNAPAEFAPDESVTGCWNGIHFDSTPATNAPSRLAYCVLEYSKALASGQGTYPSAGGAVAVVDYADLSIENCVLRHNVAGFGGAVFLYRQANCRLAGNLLVDNHALENASAIYCAYSYPELTGNTVVRNHIENEANPYIETGGVWCFWAKPTLTNNIIRGNDPRLWYIHAQIWNHKLYYTWHNNIEEFGTRGVNENFDADPLFVSALGIDGLAGTWDDNFRLLVGSPCVDSGLNDAVMPTWLLDLDGAGRVFDGDQLGDAQVDLGAFETGDCNANGVFDADEIFAGQVTDCNANWIPDICEMHVHGTSLDCNLTDVPDECESIANGDFDANGAVNAADLAACVAGMWGDEVAITVDDWRCVSAWRAAFDHDGDGDIDLADVAALEPGTAR